MPEIRMSDQPICDFCSDPKIGRRFQCADFSLDKSPGFPELRSTGDWLACSACGSLIDAENWNGLLLRAVDKYSEKYSTIPRRVLVDRIKQTHERFRKNFVRKAGL